MRTDNELWADGFEALTEALGIVDAERFITLILREPVDYTEWRAGQWIDTPVEVLAQQAGALRNEIIPLAPHDETLSTETVSPTPTA
jgi:hypothetical protein